MTVRGSERLLDQGATYQRLAGSGRLTMATLLGLRDTGQARDGDPVLDLELRLDLDGVRRVVRHRQVISNLAARELVLWSSVPVRIDPHDPTILLLA